jgi:hypothetical protein
VNVEELHGRARLRDETFDVSLATLVLVRWMVRDDTGCTVTMTERGHTRGL